MAQVVLSPNVRLVYSHTKRNSGTYNLVPLTEPLFLDIGPIGVAHPRVVGGRGDAPLLEGLTNELAVLPGETVNYSGHSWEIRPYKLQQFLRGGTRLLASDLVLQVNSVTGTHKPNNNNNNNNNSSIPMVL